MKSTAITDNSIEKINETINFISGFNIATNGNFFSMIEISWYVNKLKLQLFKLDLIDLKEIKKEFWETCDDYDKIADLMHIYKVKFDILLNWRNDITETENAFNDIIRSEMIEFNKSIKMNQIEINDNDANTIQEYYFNISYKIKYLKYQVVLLFKEWNAMSKNSNNGLIEATLLEEPSKNKKKDFTTKRQVLAMYYLLNEIGCRTGSVDRTVFANFIEFMTGKNYTSIYKTLSEPHKGIDNQNNKNALKDMEYVKQHFEKMEINEIVKKISSDMKI